MKVAFASKVSLTKDHWLYGIGTKHWWQEWEWYAKIWELMPYFFREIAFTDEKVVLRFKEGALTIAEHFEGQTVGAIIVPSRRIGRLLVILIPPADDVPPWVRIACNFDVQDVPILVLDAV